MVVELAMRTPSIKLVDVICIWGVGGTLEMSLLCKKGFSFGENSNSKEEPRLAIFFIFYFFERHIILE